MNHTYLLCVPPLGLAVLRSDVRLFVCMSVPFGPVSPELIVIYTSISVKSFCLACVTGVPISDRKVRGEGSR